MECWNVDVPADIMRNILLRLSVKILSRFKCVCKEWYTMIESQSFVNEHFVCESNQEHLLVFKPDRHRLIYVNESSPGIEEPDYLPMLGTVYDVMGPVNGVFCMVSINGGIGLLNPALKQFKQLPFLPFCHYNSSLGFGFDPLSGYYKVVSITVSNVHVYNSGSDSWTLLRDVDSVFSSWFILQSNSMYLNGVCYWVMRYMNFDFDVLAFDMSSDKFRIIRFPNFSRHELRAELAVYGGNSIVILSFIDPFVRVQDDKLIDMWVLGNDGVWTKRSTFGPFRDLRSPLGFWKNNDLMIETETTLLTMYNIPTRELRRVEARGKTIGNTSYFRNSVYTYKESLLFLKSEGERDNCKLWDISSAFVPDFFKGLEEGFVS